MRNHLYRLLIPFKGSLEKILRFEASVSRFWAFYAHRRLMAVQWRLQPQPEHFDQNINQYYQWVETRDPMWMERGIFGMIALTGGDILDLACGDGFYDERFYSARASRVVAVDFDPTAIATARAEHSAPNVEYVLADIRSAMPQGQFTNVIWNAAIEHFTEEETRDILTNIKQRLTSDGVLTGYTMVARSDGVKALSHHEYEYKSTHDLASHLAPFFQHVKVFETQSLERRNLYFWASDGVLPFDPEWPRMVTQ